MIIDCPECGKGTSFARPYRYFDNNVHCDLCDKTSYWGLWLEDTIYDVPYKPKPPRCPYTGIHIKNK